jgi:sugar phosphate permease
MGYKSTTAQLFTVPPNIAAFILVLLTSTLSDKIKARGSIMAVCCILAMAGYIMLLASKANSVRYGGTFLVGMGVYPGSPMIMVCLTTNAK